MIDDPDKVVYEHVRDRLIAAGPDVLPYLETSWRKENYNISIQERVDDIIASIQFEATYAAMQHWLQSNDRDLLEGALIVASYLDPFLNKKDVRDYLDYLERQVWTEYSYKMTALEQIYLLNKVFFQQEGFTGDSKDYHAPCNSIITDVIALRKGNPLSLAVLYTIVGQRLDIPVYGVNLPGHFVVAYTMQNHFSHLHQSSKHTGEVLFYVNPFHKGRIFDYEEVDVFLKKLKIEPKLSHFMPCTNSTIVKRMLSNLEYAFNKSQKDQKASEVRKIKNLLV